MDNIQYFTVDGTSALELDEKKSRFIAVVTHVETSQDVESFVAKLKKNNKDAKHIPYGFVLGKDLATAKNNDDGEPGGSAGAPISEAIKQAGFTNCLVAVVRYHGGINLGKSKLTSTYFKVSSEALKLAKIARMVDCAVYALTVKYPDFTSIGTYLRDNRLPIISAEYGDVVSLRVAFPSGEVDKHISEIKMKMTEEFMCSKIDSAYFRID